MTIGEQERLAWLRLARSGGIGPVTIRDLVDHFGSAAKALDALPDLAKRGGRSRPLRICTKPEAEREIETLGKLGARLIARPDPDYPEALAAIEDAPPVIAIKGRAELLQASKIALVGARNASANGRRIAADLAAGLAQAGQVVVSGMARGIDTAAHLGALNARGGTIAVVAGGIDILYPPENAALFDRLGVEGLILAEAAPGTEPVARHFPRRNRIISGLSQAVVVVEAALKSGSLITARCALDQGREVMAVPGSPLDPRCRGGNRLIREGARLVEDFECCVRYLWSHGPLRPLDFFEAVQIESRQSRPNGESEGQLVAFLQSRGWTVTIDLSGARPGVPERVSGLLRPTRTTGDPRAFHGLLSLPTLAPIASSCVQGGCGPFGGQPYDHVEDGPAAPCGG